MVSLKKYIPCKCGANNSFEFSSDLAVEDLTLSARCPTCNAAVSISISSLLSSPSQQEMPLEEETQITQEEMDTETKENVEQAVRDLFKS